VSLIIVFLLLIVVVDYLCIVVVIDVVISLPAPVTLRWLMLLYRDVVGYLIIVVV